MLSVDQRKPWSEASSSLLSFILSPEHWVFLPALAKGEGARPGLDPRYQRTVEGVKVCASVDVTDGLQGFLRVGFFAPGLTPVKGSDYLEALLKPRLPFFPNQEWQVEVDAKKWIHFIRRYAGGPLSA